jgi:hypothetical protein
MDDTKRTHEVRVGMSLYWVETRPEADGFAWSAGDRSGWAKGSRFDAVVDARKALPAVVR